MLSPVEVIDVAPVRDELGLAAFRCRYLAPLVTKTYFGEAGFTHSGEPKPLHFEQKFDGFDRGLAEVEVVTIPTPPEGIFHGNRWFLEKYSREWLVEYVVQKHPNAIIMVSDLDEIPTREQIDGGKSRVLEQGPRAFPMRTAYRKANWIMSPNRPSWKKAKVALARHYTPGLRLRFTRSVPGEPGVHFSYLGMKAEDIRLKYSQFAHQEFDHKTLSSDSFIGLSDDYRLDHLGRSTPPGFGLLHQQAFEEMGEPQQELLKDHPEFFSFEVSRHTLFDRLLAAQAVSRVVASAQSTSSVKVTGPSEDESQTEINQSVRTLSNLLHLLLAVTGIKSVVGRVRALRKVWE